MLSPSNNQLPLELKVSRERRENEQNTSEVYHFPDVALIIKV